MDSEKKDSLSKKAIEVRCLFLMWMNRISEDTDQVYGEECDEEYSSSGRHNVDHDDKDEFIKF